MTENLTRTLKIISWALFHTVYKTTLSNSHSSYLLHYHNPSSGTAMHVDDHAPHFGLHQ